MASRGLGSLLNRVNPPARGPADDYLDADRRAVAERVAEVFRWVFILVLLILANFGALKPTVPGAAVDAVLLGWAVDNLVITVVLSRGHQPGPRFGLATMAIDIVAGALLVYFSNGLTSPYVLALFLAIIASAVRFGLAYSLVSAIVIAFIYLFVGGSTPVQDYIDHPDLGLETAGRVFLFVVVALVTGLIGEELIRERRLAVSRAAKAEALQQMSSALAYSLDVNDLFEVVLQQAVRITGADSGGLILAGGGRPQLVAYHGRGGKSDKSAIARGDALLDRVMKTREAVHIKGAKHPDHALLGMAPPLSLMVVPITVAERVVAVLRLASYHRAEAFNDQQFFMVSELAASASGPLANALRYERKTKEAITDGLTGLLNHREFRHRVELEFSRFRRRGTAFSVMLIDIDLFKSVNDSMGHTHGDEVLKSAADLVRRAVRDHDLVARYGGDELAVLLPETGPDQARSAAERLVAAVHRAGIPATPTHPLTFSIGTATCPVDGITIDEVVMAADQALYFAKRAGRDTSMTASEIARRYVDDSRGLLDALSESGPQMIVAIARAVDAADPAGPGHASRIAAVADAIVRRLGRPEGELELVRSAALLHEAGRLAETHGLVDWRAEHPALAEEILRRGRFLPELVTLVRHHHERWDGHGGPDGLAGEEIPMLARVLAVSERYEELTTAGAGSLEALDRITEDAGHAYDPAVVEALAALVGEGDRLGAVLRAAAPPVRVVETLSKA